MGKGKILVEWETEIVSIGQINMDNAKECIDWPKSNGCKFKIPNVCLPTSWEV
jgi:hypothetical protein